MIELLTNTIVETLRRVVQEIRYIHDIMTKHNTNTIFHSQQIYSYHLFKTKQQKIEEMEEELQKCPESEDNEKTEIEHIEISESSNSDTISFRLSRAEGTLRNLASDAAALALHAAHPDLVRPQLRRCLVSLNNNKILFRTIIFYIYI